MSGNYLAIDLGAESGRTIVGTITGGQLTLTETHRFANIPVRDADALCWDIDGLWREIKFGIKKSVEAGFKVDSIGVDTWGVDFALLDENDGLIGGPIHYRDARTDGILDTAFNFMPRDEIFAHTGIQFMQFNTLYQLLAVSITDREQLDRAKTFLTIPDLLNYWLSGKLTNEFTNATTTQCLDPRQRNWSDVTLKAMGIPRRIFLPLTQPGTDIGGLTQNLVNETGAVGARVIVPACHDTGSAVAAVPAIDDDFVWLSSGTWSIMGAELKEPVLTEQALQYNFTNEGGVFGTWRFSKNIMGLWLIQECKRAWETTNEVLSYNDLTSLAAKADPFIAVIDPDSPDFFHPGDMPAKIQRFCLASGQRVPKTKGEILRVAIESLALKYRWVLERTEELTNRKYSRIQIIGGGTQNRLLDQFTADASGRPVIAGPIEATAIGNVMLQAIGLGHISDLPEARKMIRESFTVETYHPGDRAPWDGAYIKFLALLKLN